MNSLSGSGSSISAEFKWEEIAKVKLIIPRNKKPGDLALGFIVGAVSAGVLFIVALLN